MFSNKFYPNFKNVKPSRVVWMVTFCKSVFNMYRLPSAQLVHSLQCEHFVHWLPVVHFIRILQCVHFVNTLQCVHLELKVTTCTQFSLYINVIQFTASTLFPHFTLFTLFTQFNVYRGLYIVDNAYTL